MLRKGIVGKKNQEFRKKIIEGKKNLQLKKKGIELENQLTIQETTRVHWMILGQNISQ